MCGISGFLNRDKDRPADASLLRRMTDVIAHRGPVPHAASGYEKFV